MLALHGIPHAFAHTWESCRAMQATTGYETFLYCFRSPAAVVMCPVATRPIGAHVDVVTPYGFSGFIGRGDHPGFAAEWKRFAVAQGWVCGYLVVNPILARPRDYDPADVYRQQDLYVLDLRLSEDELLARSPVIADASCGSGSVPGAGLSPIPSACWNSCCESMPSSIAVGAPPPCIGSRPNRGGSCRRCPTFGFSGRLYTARSSRLPCSPTHRQSANICLMSR